MDCLAYDLIVSKILAAVCFVALMGFSAVVLYVTWKRPAGES